jgi:glutaredoxin-like protein NrdH
MNIVVYTQQSCIGCVQTKKHLNKRGIPYTEKPIDDYNREDALAYGYRTAPIVVVTTDTGGFFSWAGYSPDKLDAIAYL